MSDVEARFARIEQEVRTWRAVAFASAAIAIVACVLALRPKSTEAPKEIRLRHIGGETAVVLSPKALRFFAPGGNVVAEILPGDSSELRLTSADGSQRIAARADKAGSTFNVGSGAGGPQVTLLSSVTQADVLTETDKSSVRVTADQTMSHVAVGKIDGARAVVHADATQANVEARDERSSAALRTANHAPPDVWLTEDGSVRAVRELFQAR